MKGTEKQVKYANDIKKEMIRILEEIKLASEVAEYKKEVQKIKNLERIQQAELEIKSVEDAGTFISKYKEFLNLDIVQKAQYFGKRYSIAYIILEIVIDKLNVVVL